MRWAFVILNYLAPNSTILASESIRNNVLSQMPVQIVIVDNGSFDDSASILQEYANNHTNVHFLATGENLGFAKGNNVGFTFARSKLNADFIVVMNNDVIITQKSFVQSVENKFQSESFSVLGPDVINPQGVHQNPIPNKHWTPHKVRKERLKRRLKLLTLTFRIQRKRKTPVSAHSNSPELEQRNVPLHGSILIFSPEFSLMGFDPNTFLYLEEDILFAQLRQCGLSTQYFPGIRVTHQEDVSTKRLNFDSIEQEKFKNINWIKSSYELEKILIHENES